MSIAAPPQQVWDTYFIHIRKADYRPGTKVIEAEIVNEAPLTVRATLQHDIASRPRQIVMIYDLYEPYSRYRLRLDGSGLTEEGELTPETGGTRLRTRVIGRRRGLLLPWIARRRVERNLAALKAVCEGRPAPPQRGALPRATSSEIAAAVVIVAAIFVPLPWQAHIALTLLAIWLVVRYGRRFLLLARRL